MNYEETIIAPATGMQSAAIAVLRISGEKAFEITENAFNLKIKKKDFGKIARLDFWRYSRQQRQLD